VRVGNAAAAQVQHDIFGEMVLALAPVFFDDRFSAERTPASLALLERLTRKAIALAGTPDAGIWEYRTDAKPQTFSSLMSWAAADRMAALAARHTPARPPMWPQRRYAPDHHQAWNPRLNAFPPPTVARIWMPRCSNGEPALSARGPAPACRSRRSATRCLGWLAAALSARRRLRPPDNGLPHLQLLAGGGVVTIGRGRGARRHGSHQRRLFAARPAVGGLRTVRAACGNFPRPTRTSA
jgi:hypothetical protein